MDRRELLTGAGALFSAHMVATTALADAKSGATTAPATEADVRFMQLAIDQARLGDYPFGAAIVRDGHVLALAHNRTRSNGDPTAHAEMMAIRAFLQEHRPEDLRTTTLYASGEPCVMCMGAIIWSGIKRLVFAASIAELATRIGQIDITARQIADATPFTAIEITGGVLAADAMRLFQGPQSKP